jgi:hypothetical protein
LQLSVFFFSLFAFLFLMNSVIEQPKWKLDEENYSEEIGKTIVENKSSIPSPLLHLNNQTRYNFGCVLQQFKVRNFYKWSCTIIPNSRFLKPKLKNLMTIYGNRKGI